MKIKEKLQERLVYLAKKQIGKPYEYGAKLSKAPKIFDCSSFIQYIFKKIGIDLPRTTIEQAHIGKAINLKNNKLRIGDLMFFRGTVGRYNPEFPQGVGHVVMYMGDNKIIHAKWRKNKDGSDDGEIREESLGKSLKRKDLVIIKRILR